MAKFQIRAEVDDYTNRVLGVIKERYGLKDKSEALNKFAELYGEDFVELEVKPEFITEILELSKEHDKKHKSRTVALKELDRLSGADV